MACFATPFGLRYAAHCFNRAHAQQSGSALIPAGGKLGVRSPAQNRYKSNNEHTPDVPGIAINDIEGLHRAIAHGIVKKGGRLTGTELRFLRQAMRLSRAKLATMLGNEIQTVALWEKQGSQPKIADRFIRAIYLELNEGNAQIREIIGRLVNSDQVGGNARLTLEQDRGRWKVAA